MQTDVMIMSIMNFGDNKMAEKRYVVKDNWIEDRYIGKLLNIDFNTITDAVLCCDLLNDMENKKMEYVKRSSKYLEENELLKKGMIGVVDRYIKNVECNPPSSARTYGKIKGALINIREDLRSLIGDLE